MYTLWSSAFTGFSTKGFWNTTSPICTESSVSTKLVFMGSPSSSRSKIACLGVSIPALSKRLYIVGLQRKIGTVLTKTLSSDLYLKSCVLY